MDTRSDDAPPELLSTTATAGCQAVLHPLVLVTVSDHFTRKRAEAGADVQVCGILLGAVQGRQVEISNSFEIVVEDGQIKTEFLEKRLEQYKEVFKTQDIVGWYATGRNLEQQHLALHKQVMNHAEAPLFLFIDPVAAPTGDELPISIFETAFDLVADSQEVRFVRTSYTIATEDAERIGVDHIVRVSDTTGAASSSEVSVQMMGVYNSIGMLLERAKFLRDYLVAVKEGKATSNPQVLREINTLCSRLPVADVDLLADHMLKDGNDTAAVSLLALMTKLAGKVGDAADKFNVAHEASQRRTLRHF